MINTITIFQVISAIILTILVLMQSSSGGLSDVFGGGGGSGAFRTKRGMEKKLFTLTIIFAIIFIGLSIANILVQA